MMKDTKFDFRLNTAEFSALLEMFLEKAGEAESLETGDNVVFDLTPGYNPLIKYGTHQNAQEVYRTAGYDICNCQVNKYINGYFIKTFWISLKVRDFSHNLTACAELQNNSYVNDEFAMDCNFYNFMQNIFGEKYLLALTNYLSENMQEALKIESNVHISKLNQASSDGKHSRERKFKLNKAHFYRRSAIMDYYKLRLNYCDLIAEQALKN